MSHLAVAILYQTCIAFLWWRQRHARSQLRKVMSLLETERLANDKMIKSYAHMREERDQAYQLIGMLPHSADPVDPNDLPPSLDTEEVEKWLGE